MNKLACAPNLVLRKGAKLKAVWTAAARLRREHSPGLVNVAEIHHHHNVRKMPDCGTDSYKATGDER